MLYYIRKGREGLICQLSFPGDIPFKKISNFFQKPLDKTYLLCYTISVNRRGADHLPLKLLLKVCAISPMVFLYYLSHRSLSKGLFAHFTSFLWYWVGGAPDYHNGFHGGFLSDGVESG